MTADWKEPLDTVIDILKADHNSGTGVGWNRANSDNIKPVILDIASEGPERGKILTYSVMTTSCATRQH